ncbi:MAG: type IV secretion protein IcmD [Gammaproteobacteria bacterium RIFCSPHIGHO2_12_FULL_41_15]|nr:MAG: type IV secretion protein IcmD [Gammaproteobacteria bacterium RIFCSPHIGHO2_12_FULL_41_15]
MKTKLDLTTYVEYVLVGAFLMLFSDLVVAGGTVETFGAMASKVTESFGGIAKLISAGSYIAGLGFGLGAIMKFKQHKDNPTQVPIGTPIAMAFIASALLFFPVVLQMAGQSIFGSTETAGTTGHIGL